VTFASDGAWGSTWNPHITQEDMPCDLAGKSHQGGSGAHQEGRWMPPNLGPAGWPWMALGSTKCQNFNHWLLAGSWSGKKQFPHEKLWVPSTNPEIQRPIVRVLIP